VKRKADADLGTVDSAARFLTEYAYENNLTGSQLQKMDLVSTPLFTSWAKTRSEALVDLQQAWEAAIDQVIMDISLDGSDMFSSITGSFDSPMDHVTINKRRRASEYMEIAEDIIEDLAVEDTHPTDIEKSDVENFVTENCPDMDVDKIFKTVEKILDKGLPSEDEGDVTNNKLAEMDTLPPGTVMSQLERVSTKGRCWKGYEPVPGKEPYSEGSCRKTKQASFDTWGEFVDYEQSIQIPEGATIELHIHRKDTPEPIVQNISHDAFEKLKVTAESLKNINVTQLGDTHFRVDYTPRMTGSNPTQEEISEFQSPEAYKEHYRLSSNTPQIGDQFRFMDEDGLMSVDTIEDIMGDRIELKNNHDTFKLSELIWNEDHWKSVWDSHYHERARKDKYGF
jgi:hypothetical protein